MNLHLVLVRTENALNVGAAARALANMGGTRLVLVDPRCAVDSRARSTAAGAHPVLEHIVTYADWDDFYAAEGTGVRIALTRRGGRQRKVTALKTELEKLPPSPPPENFYLILGPEADGLNAMDLAYAHHACHLPVFGEFASMNLAQAALLGLYLVRERFPPEHAVPPLTAACAPSVQPFYFPDDLIREWLNAMGFDINARRQSAFLTLRRLFMQNEPSRHEMHVLEAVLQQNIRKLRLGLLGLAPEELTHDGRDLPVE